ncbi:hypothetical protein NK718_00185 [Alsobacter sp. SYSU M60028]|uniref:Uncharacterized protein n=1 Tax=Alsobacter ponti TaxID=2962936 RepID=A0ABT1L7I6_9HYPH|nr:hypothetical protein [Alsobacter ponti]MCP8936921.1 hypothetical protein [Alsobacter ponti]
MRAGKRLMVTAVVSLGAGLAASAAWAQSPCAACGPQVAIKDIPKALGEAGTAMGLVRSQQLLIGQINIYEMLGKGTMVDLEAPSLGQPMEVSRYVVNVQQQQWASRVDFEGPQTPRTIRVVKGDRAWNESWSEEKTKLGKFNKLKTAPADAVAKLRQQMVWLEPHAFFTQVAFAAGKKCLGEVPKACTTANSVSEEGGKTVLSVEINGRTYKGTLDAKKRIGSVETTLSLPSGEKKIVASYTGWRTGAADTTNAKDVSAEGDAALDKFHNGVYWPEKIVYEIDGAKVLDITVSGGWGNPYTVYPDPDLIAKTQ